MRINIVHYVKLTSNAFDNNNNKLYYNKTSPDNIQMNNMSTAF